VQKSPLQPLFAAVFPSKQLDTLRTPPLLSTATSRRWFGLTMRELEDRTVEFALDEELRRQILAGQRTRRLQNVSIKLDPAQIQALRKIATMKSIPYQTLIRQWLAEGIRKELQL